MADWNLIMKMAEETKKKMILNMESGEASFNELLNKFGADGMIFFKRAESYEALGKKEKAHEDFQKARTLFPMPKWKSIAREGMQRTSQD